MKCECWEEHHEKLGVEQDKSDMFDTIYMWICRKCGETWDE